MNSDRKVDLDLLVVAWNNLIISNVIQICTVGTVVMSVFNDYSVLFI